MVGVLGRYLILDSRRVLVSLTLTLIFKMWRSVLKPLEDWNKDLNTVRWKYTTSH